MYRVEVIFTNGKDGVAVCSDMKEARRIVRRTVARTDVFSVHLRCPDGTVYGYKGH